MSETGVLAAARYKCIPRGALTIVSGGAAEDRLSVLLQICAGLLRQHNKSIVTVKPAKVVLCLGSTVMEHPGPGLRMLPAFRVEHVSELLGVIGYEPIAALAVHDVEAIAGDDASEVAGCIDFLARLARLSRLPVIVTCGLQALQTVNHLAAESWHIVRAGDNKLIVLDTAHGDTVAFHLENGKFTRPRVIGASKTTRKDQNANKHRNETR
jgi:hypothetical protein